MKGGTLRQVITIERPRETTGRTGERQVYYETLLTTRARVAARGTREFTRSTQPQAETTHLFVTRYQTGVEPRMRLVWESEAYEITGRPHDPTGRKRELHIPARLVS